MKTAHDRLEDPERLAFCVRICEAAQEATDKKVKSQKKKLYAKKARTRVYRKTIPRALAWQSRS